MAKHYTCELCQRVFRTAKKLRSHYAKTDHQRQAQANLGFKPASLTVDQWGDYITITDIGSVSEHAWDE